jgi:hypothetical protein
VIHNATNGTRPIIIAPATGVSTVALAAYAGHEITQQDYVNQTIGAGKVGAHGSFNSGVLSGATAKNLTSEGN